MCTNDDTGDQIQLIRFKLEKIRTETREESRRFWFEVEAKKARKTRAQERISMITEERNATSLVSIHMFAKGLKKALGRKYSGPSWVVALEARLCRSLHFVRLLGNHMALVTTQCKNAVKEKEATLLKVEEESSVREIVLMNEIVLLNKEIQFQKAQYEKEEVELAQDVDQRVDETSSENERSAFSTDCFDVEGRDDVSSLNFVEKMPGQNITVRGSKNDTSAKSHKKEDPRDLSPELIHSNTDFSKEEHGCTDKPPLIVI